MTDLAGGAFDRPNGARVPQDEGRVTYTYRHAEGRAPGRREGGDPCSQGPGPGRGRESLRPSSHAPGFRSRAWISTDLEHRLRLPSGQGGRGLVAVKGESSPYPVRSAGHAERGFTPTRGILIRHIRTLDGPNRTH